MARSYLLRSFREEINKKFNGPLIIVLPNKFTLPFLPVSVDVSELPKEPRKNLHKAFLLIKIIKVTLDLY